MRLARPSVIALVFVAFAFTIASAPDADARGRPNRALVLTPQNVVPGPGDPTAVATFTWSTGRDGFCYLVNIESLGSFIQRIVIRRGAAGTTGPEVIQLSPSEIGIPGSMGCRPADRALVREIQRAPANYYMEVTTMDHPRGAMRGQLKQ